MLAALIGMVFAFPAFAEEPATNDPAIEEARTHFKAGVAYLQDPEGERYEEAYAEFKKSYELSKSPKVLGNVALCAMMLERDGEAIEAYTRYLRDVVDIDPDERAQNTRDLETLTAGAAHVTVNVDPHSKFGTHGFMVYDTRIPIRGAQVLNSYGPFDKSTKLVIRPGRHVVSLKIGDHESAKWEINAAPGAEIAHEFPIDAAPKREQGGPPPSAPSPSRAVPIALIAVGGAALAAGGVLGVVSLGKTHSLEDRCPNDVCPPDVYGDVDSTRTLVRATDFLLLGGGIVAAAGIGWFIFSTPSDRTAPQQASKSTFVAAPAVGTHGYGATVRVRF